MFSYRQVASVGWTLMAFMVAGALVLNLRYKSVADDSMYLDTWTGKVHKVHEVAAEPAANEGVAGAVVLGRASPGEVRLLELEALLRRAEPGSCGRIRFAFPAPPQAR
jgi:hypothetical protein